MSDESSSFRTWTPEVYENLHSLLLHVSEGIDAPLNQLAELLEVCFSVFDNVLQNPVPAESDRTKLLAGSLLYISLMGRFSQTRGLRVQDER